MARLRHFLVINQFFGLALLLRQTFQIVTHESPPHSCFHVHCWLPLLIVYCRPCISTSFLITSMSYVPVKDQQFLDTRTDAHMNQDSPDAQYPLSCNVWIDIGQSISGTPGYFNSMYRYFQTMTISERGLETFMTAAPIWTSIHCHSRRRITIL